MPRVMLRMQRGTPLTPSKNKQERWRRTRRLCTCTAAKPPARSHKSGTSGPYEIKRAPKGRDFGAWLPKQMSTGDRTILGTIRGAAMATSVFCSYGRDGLCWSGKN
jgi:hypothetical protein